MNPRCKTCKWYTEGVPDSLRQKHAFEGLGQYATGLCNLYFPRGYIARKPPHLTMQNSHCFQYEERDERQVTLYE